jgi:BolA family transcriptional regulator, general stress-responsive regulator
MKPVLQLKPLFKKEIKMPDPMPVAQQVADILRQALNPTFLDVIDESHHHEGHAGARPGGQTHFRVRIASPAFSTMSRVARERAVHAPLAGLMRTQIHALAIETRDA